MKKNLLLKFLPIHKIVVYVNGRKNDGQHNCFFHQTNKQSTKVMVSGCVAWKTKPFL